MFGNDDLSVSSNDFSDGVGLIQDGNLTGSTLPESFHAASGLLVVKTFTVDATRHFRREKEGWTFKKGAVEPWSGDTSDFSGMSSWWPMTKEGAERLHRYLGRTWGGFLLAGLIGVGIGYEIKRNKPAIEPKIKKDEKRL